MTTILADYRIGIMVADSAVNDEDMVWEEKKVYRIKGNLFGFAGHVSDSQLLIAWLKSGGKGKPMKLGNCTALMLSKEGLFYFCNDTNPMLMKSGIFAIGTGAKAAMATYEALGFQDPKRAVSIVCKHDNASRMPVRTYRLKAKP